MKWKLKEDLLEHEGYYAKYRRFLPYCQCHKRKVFEIIVLDEFNEIYSLFDVKNNRKW